MPGLADYEAIRQLNDATGFAPLTAANPNRFAALFTTMPTADAGTGGTEVSTSGTGYARVQIAGNLAAAAAGGPWTSTTLTLLSAAPAWLLALGTNGSGCGASVGGAALPNVSSISGSTVTFASAISGSAAASIANSANVQFSAFPNATASTGTAPNIVPATVTNGAVITYAVSSGTWTNNVIGWGIYDAVTSGNLYYLDYTGGGKWVPFTCTAANPGVLTVNDSLNTWTNGMSAVVTAKFGGTLPSGTWTGVLTVAGVSGQTFNLGVNSTGTAGDGLVRPIVQYGVTASGYTLSFPASNFTLSAA
jgi:hypothetical protein